MDGTARAKGRSFCVSWIAVLALLFLLGLGSRLVAATAADTVDAWQTDLDAAAAAVADNDDETAAVILNAALQVAISQDPQGFRVAITELQLHYVYLFLDKADAARHAVDAIPKLRGKLSDARLLDQADTLAKFANSYFSRWRTADASKPGRRGELMQAAAELYALRASLITRFRPDDKLALANALSDAGVAQFRSGDTDGAITSLQRAVDLWDQLQARRETLRTAGRQLAPLAEDGSMPSDLETDVGSIAPFNAEKFLALSLQNRALRQQKLQPEAALADYEAAIARVDRTIARYGDMLNRLDEGSDMQYYLGVFCANEWMLRNTRHEAGLAALLDKSRRAYVAALAQYERFEGANSKNVIGAAKALARLLRDSGDEAQAASIEQRYPAAKAQ